MSEEKDKQQIIDLGAIAKILWSKRKICYKVWSVVFILSCIWIFPQPRYYKCSVALAPESQSDKLSGGDLSSLASSFGLNLGGLGGSDAIYPTLYPQLFESPEFLVSLMNIQVETTDENIKTDYYTHLRKYTKMNPLTQPFIKAKEWISQLIKPLEPGAGNPSSIDPFHMSYRDFMLLERVKGYISCKVDKKTDVISITIEDQDPRVCAIMADSVKSRLQDFIITYRTSKARMDMEYYGELAEQAREEYDSAVEIYSDYCDSHQNTTLQAALSKRAKLENDMQIKQSKYTTMVAQYEAMKSKVQERTPAFTTLQTATIPVKPAGPKRMIFVLAMLVLSTIVTSGYLIYKNKGVKSAITDIEE